jgi:hypothetical protein
MVRRQSPKTVFITELTKTQSYKTRFSSFLHIFVNFSYKCVKFITNLGKMNPNKFLQIHMYV